MELHHTLTFPSVIINYLKSYMFHPLLSKLTCCIFFLLPGLMYGLLMARLPAVKAAAELIRFAYRPLLVLHGCFWFSRIGRQPGAY